MTSDDTPHIDRSTLLRPVPPWLVVAGMTASTIASTCWPLSHELSGVVSVRYCRGARMQDVDACFQEFAAVYQFPSNCGQNWSAFSEVMRELEWMPSKGYICVVTDAEQFLVNDDVSEFKTFCKIMSGVGEEWATAIHDGEYWDRDETPFHTVFRGSPSGIVSVEQRIKQAGFPYARLSE